MPPKKIDYGKILGLKYLDCDWSMSDTGDYSSLIWHEEINPFPKPSQEELEALWPEAWQIHIEASLIALKRQSMKRLLSHLEVHYHRIPSERRLKMLPFLIQFQALSAVGDIENALILFQQAMEQEPDLKNDFLILRDIVVAPDMNPLKTQVLEAVSGGE